MKITCLQENLNKGLSFVGRVASKKTHLPILGHVLLRAKQGNIELIATNLEIGVRAQVRGKIEVEGEFTVPAQLFANYVSLLPQERVDVVLEGTELLLSSPSARTKMKGEGAVDFPLIPEVDTTHKKQLDGGVLLNALASVVMAAATDTTRPELHGVLFDFQEKNLTLAATDSYRLAEYVLTLDVAEGNDARVIVPLDTIQELLRILQTEEGTKVSISVSDHQILFAWPDVQLVSRLSEGVYPDYKQIIPKDFATEIVLPTAECVKVIKVASLFTKSGVNDVALDIRPEEKEMRVSSANNQLGENISIVPIEGTGKTNGVVFNYRFFLDGLHAVNASQAHLRLVNNATAGVLRGKGNDAFLYLIMPIKQ